MNCQQREERKKQEKKVEEAEICAAHVPILKQM